MQSDLYTFSAPVFVRHLHVLGEILVIAEKHATEHNITPAALLSAQRIIDFPLGKDSVKLTSREYLTRFSLPNFYFHVTTAYDILRHNGVVLGKRAYLGAISAA